MKSQLRDGIWMIISTLVVACGGGSSGGGTQVSDELPVITAGDNPVGDNPGSDHPDAGSPSIVSLTAGTTFTGTVAEGELLIFEIPAQSNVVLTRLSGDPDLFVSSEAEIQSETILCQATSPYNEDTCSSDFPQTHFAGVFGDRASDFQLSVDADCSVIAQNDWVHRNMLDYYLYYDQIPVVDPASFSSPSALVSSIRANDLDRFSGVQDQAELESFFSEGGVFGGGFNWRRDSSGLPRLSVVFEDGPLGRAGLKRSDIIVSVNGVAWDDLSNELYDSFVGTRSDPLVATWVFREGLTGELVSVPIQFSSYTLDSVLHSQTIVHPEYNGQIGYMHLKQFIGPTESELEETFQFFSERNVSDLILDLRYNGGGFVRVAQQLASLIAGPSVEGETLVNYSNNDKYSFLDTQLEFENETNALGLSRVMVLTTGGTASASELVINSLKPFVEVVTFGSRTSGKPFVSRSRSFCGLSLNAMAAISSNSVGNDVLGGIEPDCNAVDDLTRDFGVGDAETSSLEGMAKSAADFLVFGTCDSPTTIASKQAPFNTIGDTLGPDANPEFERYPGALGF